MNNKYCPKDCKNHPLDSPIIQDRTHVCRYAGFEYYLREEHSKGRPVLKHRQCPYKEGKQ